MSGAEAAAWGFANRAFPADGLEGAVLEMAERVAKIPTDLQQINKRSVHRAMDAMGIRQSIRAGTELQALAFTTESSLEFAAKRRADLKKALDSRDGGFGDYRTAKKSD